MMLKLCMTTTVYSDISLKPTTNEKNPACSSWIEQFIWKYMKYFFKAIYSRLFHWSRDAWRVMVRYANDIFRRRPCIQPSPKQNSANFQVVPLRQMKKSSMLKLDRAIHLEIEIFFKSYISRPLHWSRDGGPFRGRPCIAQPKTKLSSPSKNELPARTSRCADQPGAIRSRPKR